MVYIFTDLISIVSDEPVDVVIEIIQSNFDDNGDFTVTDNIYRTPFL